MELYSCKLHNKYKILIFHKLIFISNEIEHESLSLTLVVLQWTKTLMASLTISKINFRQQQYQK